MKRINSDKASYPSGGVGAGSGVGNDTELSREKSESSVVALIQRRTNPLGSQGTALGHTRPKAVKDPVMAGRRDNSSFG